MGTVVVPILYLDIDGTVREGKDDALGRFVTRRWLEVEASEQEVGA